MIPRRDFGLRGITLAELTVYAALLGVLLSGAYATLTLSMRYFAVARASTDLQSQAQQSILHLVSEIADSTGCSITYKNQSAAASIILLSPRDRLGNFQQDASGNLLWQRWTCYSWDASSGNLTRMTAYLQHPVTVPPACPYTMTTFPRHASTIVGRSMTSLVFSGTDAVTIQARFQQRVDSSASGTPDSRIDIVDRVTFRN